MAAQVSSDPSGGEDALPCTEHKKYDKSEMSWGFEERHTWQRRSTKEGKAEAQEPYLCVKPVQRQRRGDSKCRTLRRAQSKMNPGKKPKQKDRGNHEAQLR